MVTDFVIQQGKVCYLPQICTVDSISVVLKFIVTFLLIACNLIFFDMLVSINTILFF